MPDVGGIAGERLKSFVERIERLEEERRSIGTDIKEVYAEAKGTGFDPKIIRKIIALRRRDTDAVAEEEALIDLYKRALGMLADTPLGEASIDRMRHRVRDAGYEGDGSKERPFVKRNGAGAEASP